MRAYTVHFTGDQDDLAAVHAALDSRNVEYKTHAGDVPQPDPFALDYPPRKNVAAFNAWWGDVQQRMSAFGNKAERNKLGIEAHSRLDSALGKTDTDPEVRGAIHGAVTWLLATVFGIKP